MTATFTLPPAFRGATVLPRPALEELVEQPVTMLDEADGDPDLEDADQVSAFTRVAEAVKAQILAVEDRIDAIRLGRAQ